MASPMYMSERFSLMPTLVLAAAAGWLYAVDLPLPVEMSALAMVALILRVYIGRENRGSETRDKRISALEAEVVVQRHLKHDYRTEMAMEFTALELSFRQAQKCDCGSMEPVVDALESSVNRLREYLKPPPIAEDR